MIDGEREVIEVVAAAKILVGRVGLAVDAAEGVSEVVAGGHGRRIQKQGRNEITD